MRLYLEKILLKDHATFGLDVDDVDDSITLITNNGVGNDVVVDFNTGASITFIGTGSASPINSITDLVVDNANQILVA